MEGGGGLEGDREGGGLVGERKCNVNTWEGRERR